MGPQNQKSKLFLSGTAYRMAFTAFDSMCNEPDPARQEALIKQWATGMISQLQNVGLIGMIMTIIPMITFTWVPPQLGDWQVSMVMSCWFTGIIISIGAVAVCLQQGTFLARLLSASDVGLTFPEILSYNTEGGRRRPRIAQVILWQLANGLLEASILIWVIGFVAYVWFQTRVGLDDVIEREKAISGTCLAAFFITALLYLWSMIGLWFQARKVV